MSCALFGGCHGGWPWPGPDPKGGGGGHPPPPLRTPKLSHGTVCFVRCKVLDCRKWHCTYAMPHHMAQAHPGVSHDYAGCSEEEKTKVLQAFDNFGPHCHRRRSLLHGGLCPLFSLLFSLGQTKVVVAVAVVVAAARPPMPPPVRVQPPAVVPRQALVTMCHQNPCLMGRQPAGSQEHKQPGQRSVLAPRVPARGHARSGRMIPMLEAPLLPSLLYIYIYMYETPFASLHICLWFVTRGRKGLWTNSRQHSVLL